MTTLLSAPHLTKPSQITNQPLGDTDDMMLKSPTIPTEVYHSSAIDTRALSAQTPSVLFAPPNLSGPDKVNFNEIQFITVMNEIQMSGESLIDSFSKSITIGSDKLKKMSIENMEKLKEAAEKTQDKSFWSFLQQVGECILSAISTVLGITLVSSGAGYIIGGAMIASGVINFVIFVMKNTGTWQYLSKQMTDDRKRQQELAQYLPFAASLVGSVLGIASTGAALIWSDLNAAQQGLVIAQAALGLYQGGVTIGRGLNDANATWIESDLTYMQSEKDLQKIKFEEDSHTLNQILKILRASQDAAEQVIDLAAQALRRTVLQV